MKDLMTVHEVSELTGVSIRTLHYYDEIDLLKPSVTTEAGYRQYDRQNLETLQDIMLFRELEFPLKEIKAIITNPKFDRIKALEDQIGLLELQRKRIEDLIVLARSIKLKGETDMSFDAFDKGKIEAYKNQAKEAWGDSPEYKEFEEKDAQYTEVERRANAENLMDIFYEFGDMKAKDPADSLVQAQVKKLQNFISEHYYKCSNEILNNLGDMYVAGDDMTKNINAAGGEGCAEFVNRAIKVYVKHF